jgi:hypothetical protein
VCLYCLFHYSTTVLTSGLRCPAHVRKSSRVLVTVWHAALPPMVEAWRSVCCADVALLQISQSRQGHLAQKRSERLEAERVSHAGLALLWLLGCFTINGGSSPIHTLCCCTSVPWRPVEGGARKAG